MLFHQNILHKNPKMLSKQVAKKYIFLPPKKYYTSLKITKLFFIKSAFVVVICHIFSSKYFELFSYYCSYPITFKNFKIKTYWHFSSKDRKKHDYRKNVEIVYCFILPMIRITIFRSTYNYLSLIRSMYSRSNYTFLVSKAFLVSSLLSKNSQ